MHKTCSSALGYSPSRLRTSDNGQCGKEKYIQCDALTFCPHAQTVHCPSVSMTDSNLPFKSTHGKTSAVTIPPSYIFYFSATSSKIPVAQCKLHCISGIICELYPMSTRKLDTRQQETWLHPHLQFDSVHYAPCFQPSKITSHVSSLQGDTMSKQSGWASTSSVHHTQLNQMLLLSTHQLQVSIGTPVGEVCDTSGSLEREHQYSNTPLGPKHFQQ